MAAARCLTGDLGWTNDQILPRLRREAAAGDIDAIVLFGDMIYFQAASPDAEPSL